MSNNRVLTKKNTRSRNAKSKFTYQVLFTHKGKASCYVFLLE